MLEWLTLVPTHAALTLTMMSYREKYEFLQDCQNKLP